MSEIYTNGDFEKSKKTGLVINTDTSGYYNILNKRKQAKNMSSLEQEIKSLKKDVDELRNLIRGLLNE